MGAATAGWSIAEGAIMDKVVRESINGRRSEARAGNHDEERRERGKGSKFGATWPPTVNWCEARGFEAWILESVEVRDGCEAARLMMGHAVSGST